MFTKKFSIIIPFYNSKKYLKNALNSIVNQKRHNIEIILVDDASKDKSIKLISKFKKKFKYIKILRNKINSGVGFSRNKALKNAKGKYIIFLDSDDYLFPKSLLKLENFIKKKNFPDVVVLKHKKTTYPVTNSKLLKDLDYKKKSSEKFIKYLYKKEVPFSDCWFIAVKRSMILQNNIFFPNTHFGESEYFVSKTICFMRSYSCFNQNFYFKNDRIKSLNNIESLTATVSVLENLSKLTQLLKNKKLILSKREFIKKYFKNGLGLFNTLLALRNFNELKKISKFIYKNKNYFKNVQLGKKYDNFFSLLKKKNIFSSLIKYYEKIIKTKIIEIKKIKSYKDIYVYSKSKYSTAIIKIMKKEKFKIKGIIDDSIIFKNEQFLNYKIMNIKEFARNTRDKMNETGIIITHPKLIIVKKIMKSLKNLGFKNDQIISVKF